MKAKEFCQRYNLGIDSSWIMRKYAKHDLSLVDWFNLVKDDLAEIPTQLSQSVEEARSETPNEPSKKNKGK